MRQLLDGLRVGQRDGLPPGQIHRGGNADIRDALCPIKLDNLFQLDQIHIAFERMQALGVVRIGNDHVNKRTAGQLLVQPSGGEVHITRNDVARLDEGLRQQVLRAAALVGGHHVFVSVPLLDGGFKTVEASASGVGFVAHHHRGPLPVAHGGSAGIGEQIDINIVRPQQERVITGLANSLFSLGRAGNPDLLNHFDLERLCPCALLDCHLISSWCDSQWDRLLAGKPRLSRRRPSLLLIPTEDRTNASAIEYDFAVISR